jgi:hypothetical protein
MIFVLNTGVDSVGVGAYHYAYYYDFFKTK